MTDLWDRATEREIELREDAIAEAVRHLPSGPDHPFCLACDAPIPEARRRALPGVTTCVECQVELEAAAAAFHR